jgi:hypothetical protein
VVAGSSNKLPRTLFGEFSVIFEVKGTSSEYGADYIIGSIRSVEGNHTLEELKTKEVRLFVPATSATFRLCRDSINFFKGKVKHYTGAHGGYYALYLDSIEEYTLNLEEEDDSKDDETFLGYGGTILNWKQWKDATKHNCIQCGDPANPQDEGLIWTTPNEFLCGVCAEDFTSSRFGGNV